MIDPNWLQSPITDVAALFEGLTDDGRHRLLRLFLTTGASLLGRGATAGFAGSAHRLLELLGLRRADPLGWCRIGTSARIVTYRRTARLRRRTARRAGSAFRDGDEPRYRQPSHRRALCADGVLLHVFVAGQAPAGCALVAILGASPVALRLPSRG